MKLVGSSPKILEIFEQWRGPVARGFISEAMPEIIKGAMLEALIEQKVTVEVLVEWIKTDHDLWDLFSPHIGNNLDMISKLGPYKWLTSEWLLESIRKERPDLASLILNWEKASEWLARQLENIKNQLSD